MRAAFAGVAGSSLGLEGYGVMETSQRPAEGGRTRRRERLRFGTFLASNATTLAFYELVTEEVGRRLRMPTELVVETSYESCENDVNEVCFVCSLAYVVFERRGLDLAVPVAAPVLQGERYGGRPVYFSDVIVRRDGPYRSFLDLRGRSWAYNEPLSHSGYGITRYHLVRLGETSGFFGEVVEAGFHSQRSAWWPEARWMGRRSTPMCSRSSSAITRSWRSGSGLRRCWGPPRSSRWRYLGGCPTT